MDRHTQTSEFSRRTFLTTTGAALVGTALGGLSPRSAAATRRPGRSGTLQFGPLIDTSGLDSHRHNQLLTSNPTAAMYTGLTDLDQQGHIVPGIAEHWEPNQELTAWVFQLRKGVLFHNGREVDAEAVKLNLLRIKDPAIGTDWHRGVIENIETIDVLDKYTVRLHTRVPDVAVPANVVFYPTNLIAPESFHTASEHPIGTGPFKFVSWTRWNETRLVRFENYWETDAEGHNLPYLDEIVGKPKKEDSVRLTALRTGQVHLIDNMAYADVERFKKSYGDTYNTGPFSFRIQCQ
jgi:peptide/nickel transport system substrate-binding protein